MNPRDIPRAQFMTVIKREFPEVYAQALRAGDRAGGLGDTQPQASGGFNFSAFTDAVSRLLPAYTGYRMQRDVYRVNLERAKAGQPLIDAAAFAPVVRTQVDVSPEIADRLQNQVGGIANNMLWIIGAAAVGAFILLR